MSHISHSYILIQYLEDAHQYQFENELEIEIKSRLEENEVLFTLDNFSDSTSLHYTGELLKAGKVTIICDFKSDTALGKTNAILNQAIKHPDVRLFSNQDNKVLKPFMIRLKGKMYKNVEEIWDWLQ